MLCWRVMLGYLPTDEVFQGKGIYNVSHCSLFLKCDFSAGIWNALSSFFGREIHKSEGIIAMLGKANERWCGTQLFTV